MAEAPQTPLLDGARSWEASQAAFQSVPDPTRTLYFTEIGWHDTVEDENEGAFCLVRGGSDLEELVGEVVWVKVGRVEILVYCVGGSDRMEHDLTLQRAAFFRVAPLSRLSVDAKVRATL